MLKERGPRTPCVTKKTKAEGHGLAPTGRLGWNPSPPGDALHLPSLLHGEESDTCPLGCGNRLTEVSQAADSTECQAQGDIPMRVITIQ